jgi:alpha-L-fucosidase 2
MKIVTRRSFLQLAGGAAAASLIATDARLLGAPGATPTTSMPGPERGAVSDQWTEDWESAMVTGNGRMGALVYGKPETPIIVVCQDRLYTALHDPAGIGPANTARLVPEIRQLIRTQGYAAALDFAYQKAQENGLAPGESNDFHPGFFLNGTLDGAEQATNYRRSENFETGEVTTSWRGTKGKFQTRVFVSRADNIVVLSISGPGAGQLDCTLGIGPVGSTLVQSQPKHGTDWIGFQNLYPPGNGGYDGVVRVAVRGGSMAVAGGQVTITGADEALALMRVDRYRPPHTGSADALVQSVSALTPDYTALLGRHVKIHSAIFNRVSLDLGGGADRHLTTDMLLARAAAEKRLSPALMEKIYDACRYVILCSSGDLPPNLQGIWTGTWSPPWHSDYSADANLQLAVDSMCSANMPELLDSLFRLVEAGVPSWREGAHKLAGCRGILYPARMQDQGTYFQQNHDWPWFNQVSIAGWLGHYFYDYYLYTGDREFLKARALPYLKDCALFYEDWYQTDLDGRLRSTPSFSYECAYSDNATIDFAVAHEVLTNLIAGCELLGIDTDGVRCWKALRAKIPAFMINTPQTTGGPSPPYQSMDGGVPGVPDGCLTEFIEPNMLEFPQHRHLSSLYPLFVSYQLDPVLTPALWDAALKWYEKKIANVHESESHYRMQASLCAARLGRGDDAWAFLTLMAANGIFHTSLVPSHYDHLSVFNVDASGGIPSVINNCLVYSQPGRLDLLPALPSAMAIGSITGLLARGGITLTSLAWDMPAGRLKVKLKSSHAQEVALGLPPGVTEARLTVNGKAHSVSAQADGKQGCPVRLAQDETVLQAQFATARSQETKTR